MPGSARVPGGGHPRSPRLRPRSPAGGRSWSETLRSLEEKHESLENMFEQQSRQIGNLLREYKAGLVQHKEALNQQLTNAHVQFIQPPSPGAGLGALALPGSHSWTKPQDWMTESDMESDGDSVGDSVACAATCCAVPGLEGVLPTEELLRNDEIYNATRKEFRAEPGSLQDRAIRMITHWTWPLFTSISIVLQTSVLAYLVNRQVKERLIQLGQEVELSRLVNVNTLKAMSYVLLFMWLMEMSIRIVAAGREFFVYPGGVANILEVCVLAFALVDVSSNFLPSKLPECVAGFFDFVKVFRAFRLMRLLAVCQTFNALHQLRWMLLYIATCMPSFFTALVLLSMLILIWAILFEDIALFYLQSIQLPAANPAILNGITENWAGINKALLSLTFSITGGDDYSTFMEPFQLMNQAYGWFYILLVIMVTLCFLNVLVGMFVQDSENLVTWDRSLVLTNAVKKNDFTEDILRQLFYEIDNNRTGEISLKEMQVALKRPDIRAWFLHLDIDMACNAEVFFELLDDDDSGLVNAEEFVNGCARLKGGAKPLSVESLVIETKKLSHIVNQIDARLSGSTR